MASSTASWHVAYKPWESLDSLNPSTICCPIIYNLELCAKRDVLVLDFAEILVSHFESTTIATSALGTNPRARRASNERPCHCSPCSPAFRHMLVVPNAGLPAGLDPRKITAKNYHRNYRLGEPFCLAERCPVGSAQDTRMLKCRSR